MSNWIAQQYKYLPKVSMMIDENANSWHKLSIPEVLYGNTYSNYKIIVKTQCKCDEKYVNL